MIYLVSCERLQLERGDTTEQQTDWGGGRSPGDEGNSINRGERTISVRKKMRRE